MTQEEKNKLSELTNLELVELLLNKQQESDILRHERDLYKDSDDGKWWELHEQVYKLADEVITIKYMIIKRMGGCSGTGK